MFSNLSDQVIAKAASDKGGGVGAFVYNGRWRRAGCEKMAARVTCFAEYTHLKCLG